MDVVLSYFMEQPFAMHNIFTVRSLDCKYKKRKTMIDSIFGFN